MGGEGRNNSYEQGNLYSPPPLVQKIAVDQTTLLIFLWIIQDVNMERFIGVNSYSNLLEQGKVLSIQYDISKNKKELQILQLISYGHQPCMAVL